MELNAGHKYWLDKGKLTQEQAEEQQRRNDEAVEQGNQFLLKCYEQELQKPNPNQKTLEKLKKYLKEKNLL